MRHLSFMAALVGLGLVLSSAPAFATDQGGAVSMCSKNPRCGLARVSGGVSLWVDHGSGTSEIWCPDKGDCVCVQCTGGDRPARWGMDLGHIVRPRGWAPAESLSGQGPSSAPVQSSIPATPAPQPPIL